MKKGIIVGIIIIIGLGVLVALGSIELDPQVQPITETVIVDEPETVEEIVTSEGRSISVNLSDGIGAGDR